MISIEMLLDAQTEARVRADWHRLAVAGLSSQGANPAPSNRPHVTMLVRRQLRERAFQGAVSQLPISIGLGDPIVFRHGDRGVLARPIRMTRELRSLHESVHRAAAVGDDAPHTAPQEWVPHVTLARRVQLASLERALSLVEPAFVGVGAALRRWDSRSREVTLLSCPASPGSV